MAQFDYESYAAQQASRRTGSSTGGRTGAQTHFVNEFLKNDGDSVVVRFPYHAMSDIKFETTHTVTFPGDKYGKRVRCEGDGCALCKQGVKVDVRFFVKAIVYVTDPTTGGITLVPAIWDRPAAFADIDLKTLFEEYGDLTESLFKIKRNGTGLDTRYTISIITNKAVYKPEVYKADFSGLEGIDPVRILTKSLDQYMTALNPAAAEEKGVQANDAAKALMGTPEEEAEVEETLGMTNSTPVNSTPVSTTTTSTDSGSSNDRPKKRYTF